MSCSNQTVNSAVITPVLAAGSTTSPFVYQVNISQRLCHSTCASRIPSFSPTYSLVGYSNVGNNAYVATIHVEGVIAYIPCNGNECCTKMQLVSQNFTIPFYAASAPSEVSVSQGTAVNAVAVSACQTCSRSFVSETPLFLTVTVG